MKDYKTFTIAEFNAMTPLIDRICASIIDTWKKIIRQRNKLENLENVGKSDMTVEERAAVKQTSEIERQEANILVEAINGYVQEIEQLGGFVHEMNRGIVFFPFMYNSVRRFICYCPQDLGAQYYINADETPKDRKKIE
jgi:hypothetical protein